MPPTSPRTDETHHSSAQRRPEKSGLAEVQTADRSCPQPRSPQSNCPTLPVWSVDSSTAGTPAGREKTPHQRGFSEVGGRPLTAERGASRPRKRVGHSASHMADPMTLACDAPQPAVSGRYWARTSDPQLVEPVLSQLT